jgi:hypothetical protein
VFPLLLRYPRLYGLAAALAGVLLRTGPLRLMGDTPNGAHFVGQPWQVWTVRASRACIEGRDTGPERPLRERLALGDVRIPRRALFAATDVTILPRRYLDEMRARSARPVASTTPVGEPSKSSQ